MDHHQTSCVHSRNRSSIEKNVVRRPAQSWPKTTTHPVPMMPNDAHGVGSGPAGGLVATEKMWLLPTYAARFRSLCAGTFCCHVLVAASTTASVAAPAAVGPNGTR